MPALQAYALPQALCCQHPGLGVPADPSLYTVSRVTRVRTFPHSLIICYFLLNFLMISMLTQKRFVRTKFALGIVFLIALSWVDSPRTQTQQIKFQSFSGTDGLSQVTVRCIFQDSRGLIWFGTQDGLNRFDGYAFTVYRHREEEANSLSNNSISAIFEDHSGTLWIGTTGGGINRFDRATDTFTHLMHDPANPNSLSDDYVSYIYQDNSAALWVGTEQGLNLFNATAGNFTRYQIAPANTRAASTNSVRWILPDANGALILATDYAGVVKLDRQNQKYTSYLNSPADSQQLSGHRILTIYQDSGGAVWIGTDAGGLFRVDNQTQELTNFRHDIRSASSIADNTIRAIHEDTVGTLWIGTDSGLDTFDSKNNVFIHNRFDTSQTDTKRTQSILSLCEDSAGLLWIGTDSGVGKLSLNNRRFVTYEKDPANPDSLSSNSVRSIYQDRLGKLWIGTTDAGLNQYDRQTGKFQHYRHDAFNPRSLSHNDVTAIAEDPSGNLWVGTNGGGLNRFDRNSGNSVRYLHDQADPNSLSQNTVWVVRLDRGGALWLGTAEGLDKFDPQTSSFTHYRNDPGNPLSLSQNNIRAIWEDGSGALWIGTRSGGLNRFDSRSGTFTRYQHQLNNPASLSSDAVYALYQDAKGTLWVGTTEGLNQFDSERQSFTHFGEKDGLANNTIYGILGDSHGNLWLSTNKGISRFNPQTRTFRNYDVDDGLQDNEFNGGAAFQSQSGEMFFGGIKGFNRFRPEDVKDNSFQPPIVLTAFKKFDQKVKLSKSLDELDELELSYRDYVFSFEFAALDYTAPQKNQYAYKLEGFDRDWNYSGTRRVAIYTNLGGGDYVFRVKGSNSDGVWNEEGTSIRVKITPPFWKRWWFIGSTVGLVILLGVFSYRRRISNLNKARAAQEAFSRQLIDSQENERKRIAGELHDSLGQNLLIIKNRALLGLTPGAAATVSMEQLNEISFTATQAIEEVREIARNLRPYKLDRLGLTKALESIIEQAANSSEIEFSFLVDPVDGLFSKEAEINLYRVVQESVNNILKHSQATDVRLRVARDDHSVVLEIKDNGVGFDTASVTGEDGERRGFGLAGIAERARIIGGKYAIRSSPGNGTSITIKIELQGKQS
jgi:signal transduction histidine kinase/ligand-binding sensor domain-containing protein